MPEYDEIKLHKVIVGGEPVGFTKSTGLLHLAGDNLTLEQWQEIERRVNLFFERAGLLNAPKKQSDPNSGTSSFLTNNLKQVLERDRGLIKDAPFPLNLIYDGVITKEGLCQL